MVEGSKVFFAIPPDIHRLFLFSSAEYYLWVKLYG